MEIDDPDAALVSLAKEGDVRAFEALVVKYQRRIARHVARYVKRASDVEDVVQEVFIKAFRGIASFKGESTIYTWLYQIAKNTAFSFVTRQSKIVVLQEDIDPSRTEESMDLHGSDGENPERLLLSKQIAEMLQVPIGTVRIRIFRAREFIAQRLEPLLDPVRDRRW